MAIRRVAIPMPAASTMSDGGISTLAAFTQEKTNAAAETTRRQINTNPFVNGVWVKGIEVPAAAFPPVGATVLHGLKQTPQGYIITFTSSSPSTWAPKSTMNERSLTFYNSSGSTQTIDAWIF